MINRIILCGYQGKHGEKDGKNECKKSANSTSQHLVEEEAVSRPSKGKINKKTW